jgi:hypothetical protein
MAMGDVSRFRLVQAHAGRLAGGALLMPDLAASVDPPPIPPSSCRVVVSGETKPRPRRRPAARIDAACLRRLVRSHADCSRFAEGSRKEAP